MTQLPMFGQPGPPPDKPAGDRPVRLRMLVTAVAAPNPSALYGETVCVGGLSTDPDRPGWIRLYPVHLRQLNHHTRMGPYDLISVDAVPARRDARKESWRPRLPSVRVEDHLHGWAARRRWLDPAVSTEVTMCRLQQDASIHSPSVALIPPAQVTRLQVQRHPAWTPEQQARIDRYVQQPTLDADTDEDRIPLRAPRFRGFFHYACREPGCRGHRQRLLDWDFVQFQQRLDGVDEPTAMRRLQQRFHARMCGPDRDVAFYVGNLVAHPTSFIVGGVYWPPRARSAAG